MNEMELILKKIQFTEIVSEAESKTDLKANPTTIRDNCCRYGYLINQTQIDNSTLITIVNEVFQNSDKRRCT